MKITVKTKPVKPVVPVKTFHLEMTEEEAIVLFVLSGSVTGSVTGSSISIRNVTDKLYDSMSKSLGLNCDDYFRLKEKFKITQYLKIN